MFLINKFLRVLRVSAVKLVLMDALRITPELGKG